MGISIQHLLLTLVIVILVFGTKRLKTVGSDLGDAIKGFRKAIKDGSEDRPLDDLKHDTIADEKTPSKENNQV